MDSKQMKVRVNLTTREIELEGNLDLIKEHFGDHLEDLIIKIRNNPLPTVQSSYTTSINSSKSSNLNTESNEQLPDSFGEFYNKFPKNLSNVDKILLACFYLQSQSEGKFFTVREASDILIDQGISLSNASAFNKANISTKRVFKLSGKNFRVSDIGHEYLKSLMQV